MSYFSPHPVTGANNRSKRITIPVKLNGHTTATSATAVVQDPYQGTANVQFGNNGTLTGTLTDASWASTSNGATVAPCAIYVEVLDGPPKDNAGNVMQGNATRFRKGFALVTKADSAGNAAQFVVGVVEPGGGAITAKGHVQAIVKLNGSMVGAIAVSGTFIDVTLEWD